MKASIIIRTYNSSKTIERAIKSALHQDFPSNDYEIIVVDDGSVDNTTEIAAKYKKNNLRLVELTKKGPVETLNKGIKQSRGKYVVALDADDLFEKDLLSVEIKIAESDKSIDFVYCDYWEKHEDQPKKLITVSNRFEGVLVGTLFRNDRLKSVGYFRKGIYFAEYDLFLRTLGLWRGYHVKKPLFTYNRGSDSLTANFKNVVDAVEKLKKLHPKKKNHLKKIRSYLMLDKIIIKKADVFDVNFLLNLRNLKSVRKFFFNSKKILPREHNRWFKEKLNDSNCRIFVITAGSQPVGQIRYELDHGSCEVGISIHPKYSGFGIGSYALNKTSNNKFLGFKDKYSFSAHVKLENLASQVIFKKAGFKTQGIVKFKNVNCILFEK